MREISEISIQSLGETFELADATARKFGVNTVYPIDIGKRGSGNNILYITVPGVESYDDMDGKSVALNTGIYCVQWDEPQTVYININGLGNKALYRPLPTNASADYDDRQYNTAKYVKGEISRQQTLIVSFRKDGSVVTATLLNPAPAPRATKEITKDSSDDVSYVTPKSVATAMRGTLKNPISVTENDLDNTYIPGYYKCVFSDRDEESYSKECIVEVRTYTRDDGSLHDIAVQRMWQNDVNTLEKYELERYAVIGEGYTDWKDVTGHGTWTKPFVVNDPDTNLSTLTTPGIYYFDFDDHKEISDRGFYNRGYMEVAEVWGDNVGRTIISQKICTGYDGKVYYFERTIDTNKAGTIDNDTGWRQFETTSGTVGKNTLEGRLKLLEEKIKTKGTWADPFVVSDPGTDLSTLTTPGIYYFYFGEQSKVHIDVVDSDSSSPYYINRCFMLTTTGSGDFTGTAVYQKIWGFYEEDMRECSRIITTEGEARDWVCITDDNYIKRIYQRLDAIEAKLMS